MSSSEEGCHGRTRAPQGHHGWIYKRALWTNVGSPMKSQVTIGKLNLHVAYRDDEGSNGLRGAELEKRLVIKPNGFNRKSLRNLDSTNESAQERDHYAPPCIGIRWKGSLSYTKGNLFVICNDCKLAIMVAAVPVPVLVNRAQESPNLAIMSKFGSRSALLCLRHNHQSYSLFLPQIALYQKSS